MHVILDFVSVISLVAEGTGRRRGETGSDRTDTL
jgi:hypothetical protein